MDVIEDVRVRPIHVVREVEVATAGGKTGMEMITNKVNDDGMPVEVSSQRAERVEAERQLLDELAEVGRAGEAVGLGSQNSVIIEEEAVDGRLGKRHGNLQKEPHEGVDRATAPDGSEGGTNEANTPNPALPPFFQMNASWHLQETKKNNQNTQNTQPK